MLPDYLLAAHSLLSISTLFATAILLSCISIAIRRVYFHPLSHIPGPRLAAITSVYKIYFEVLKGGDFLRQITHLHDIYGPVIRIGPCEVHFSDPSAYSQIYNVSSRFTKYPDFYQCFSAGDSAFGVMDPAVSKLRRAILHPFFSRKAMSHLEPVIQAKVNELLTQIVNSKDQIINMFLAYRALTLDIITLYVFGQSLHATHIPGFRSSFLLDIQNALPMLWIIKAFPSSIRLLSALPKSWSDRLLPAFTAFMGVRQAIVAWVSSTTTTEKQEGTQDCFAIYPQLRKFGYPGKQQVFTSQETLVDEAVSLLQAGSDTVASACTIGTTYVLLNPAVRQQLVKELESVWQDGEEFVELAVLESLPYLTAVIKESLRLSHGFVTPLPRVVGHPGAVIGGVYIPEGSVVSMSVAVVHLNPHIFQNPHQFIPARWLPSSGDDDEHNQLDRFLVAFSRGPRMCLGIHLAWAELYTIFAAVFRKLDMGIVSPRKDDDLQQFKDYFVPVHDGGSHLRIKVASVRS